MRWQITKKGLAKFFLKAFSALLGFFLISYLVLQIPAVQRKMLNRYLGGINLETKFKISVNYLHLYWWDRLEVGTLTVTDPESNRMVRLKKMLVNFRIGELQQGGEVNIDGVYLDSADVQLVYIAESDSSKDLNFNELIYALNKMFAPKVPSANPKSPKVNIGEIILENSRVSLHHPDKDSVKVGFDPNHFALSVDDVELQAFKLIGDTIQFHVASLVGEEINHHWPVHDLRTFFRTSQGGMEFYGLNLTAGQSFVQDTVVFKHNSTRDFNDFINKISIKAKLKECVLHPDDVAFFSGGIKPFPLPAKFSGVFSGRINRFTFQNVQLEMGQSKVFGKVEMDGLPNIKETFINVSIKPSTLSLDDWKFAMPTTAFEKLKPLGTVRASGDYIGFYNDFVADGKVLSPLGEIDSDVNIKINETNLDQSQYSGNLKLTDFWFGKYLNDTSRFQRISMEGNIQGQGLSVKTADFTMNGKVHSIGILKYNYSNITSNARFKENYFNGDVTIRDPNLAAHVIGSIDFRNNADLINVTAQIDTAVLKQLGLIKEDFSFASNLRINSKGLHLDSLSGLAELDHVSLRYRENAYSLNDIKIESKRNGKNRELDIQSSIGNVAMKGDFYYTTLFHDVANIFEEFNLNIRNDKAALKEYYASKDNWDQQYKANFKADLIDINPLLMFLNIDASVSKNTLVEGDFTNGFTTIFHGFTSIPTLRFQDKFFYNSQFEFNGSKIHDTTSVLAMLTVISDRQQINPNVKTKNLLVEAIWNRDHVDVGFDVDQEGIDNSLRLKAELDFLEDSTRLKFLPSTIKALGQNWEVNPDNLIMFKGEEWDLEHIEIRREGESAKLHGRISRDASMPLRIVVQNLGVDLVNSISRENFGGTLNADVTLKNLYGAYSFQSELQVEAFKVNDFLVGDISGSTLWDADLESFIVNLFVDKNQLRIVDVTGLFNPEQETSPLNLTARLNKTNIKVLEPVMRGLFSNWDGTASGSFDITGTFGNPTIVGEVQIEKGKVRIDYLNTTYQLEGKVAATKNQISLEKIGLTDLFGNKGEVNGFIRHQDFNQFQVSMDGKFNNFQVMNTTQKDNNTFYGQAYATGTMNVLGPFDNLKVSATARSEKNTRVYIPVAGSSTVERSDFMTFITLRDTTKRNAAVEEVYKSNSNFSLSLNLDLTPDAYGEIIFDIKAGDIIRGYGRGDIKLDMDTKGEFSMFGLYEFEKGFYNFTLGGVINKEFAINKGSRISWYGDPYAGQVNINAGYRQLASIAPIIADPAIAQSPSLRRKFPIEVLLKLDGPMLAPQINFDINAKDLPENMAIEGSATPLRPNFEFQSFKSRLDEQELKKQVFSLIVLRRFSPPDAFTTSGGIANSVSEFLSNQLSYWLSQVDQNLEVSLDLGTMDQESFNTFQLRMSYSFMNGRLRITRDGALSSNQFARSDIASIAGDWTVDYLLTPDGKFKAKMYSRSNYNALLNSIGAQSAVTTGISLAHTQSFNEFADLVRFSRRRRQQEILQKPELAPETEEESKSN